MTWVQYLFGVALCTILFSFSSIIGAHQVQVFLDDQKVIDHYVESGSVAPTLHVNPAENHAELIVRYNECGRTVTGRTITIKDEKNNVLKDWRFEGPTAGLNDPMVCSIKEITALKQKGSNTLKLYYSSKEFSEGLQIANLVIDGGATTALK